MVCPSTGAGVERGRTGGICWGRKFSLPSIFHSCFLSYERRPCHPKGAEWWPPDAHRPSALEQVDGPERKQVSERRAVAGSFPRPSTPAGGQAEAQRLTPAEGTRGGAWRAPAASPGVSSSWNRHTEQMSPKACSRPRLHSRPPRMDRINPRPGLTVRRRPGLQGEAWPATDARSHTSNKTRSTCRGQAAQRSFCFLPLALPLPPHTGDKQDICGLQ